MIGLVEKIHSVDGSRKFLFRTPAGNHYEALYFTFSEDGGLMETPACCLSSQVGCRVGCAFCATGRLGFRENLDAAALLKTAEQIAGQLEPGETPPAIFTFMGMGEPLLNLDALIDFYPLAMSRLRPQSLSLSTIVIPKLLIRLAHSPADYDLFVSLHSPWEDRRRALIPLAGQYGFGDFFAACELYYRRKLAAADRKIKFSYLLLAGVNDAPDDIARLAGLLRDHLPEGSYRVQLLLYNSVTSDGFCRTTLSRARKIRAELVAAGADAYLSLSRGTDVGGGCGQFAGSRQTQAASPLAAAGRPETKSGPGRSEVADAGII